MKQHIFLSKPTGISLKSKLALSWMNIDGTQMSVECRQCEYRYGLKYFEVIFLSANNILKIKQHVWCLRIALFLLII